jgi:hypothetical protein
LEKAATVVAVNDGAGWIQSFIDYHCPQAVRIIDFAHALGYIADWTLPPLVDMEIRYMFTKMEDYNG